MANPVIVNCPKDVWTKVATGISTGVIHMVSNKPREYKYTYRDTGGTAPTTRTNEEVRVVNRLVINSANLVDVYIMPISDDGVVRCDL